MAARQGQPVACAPAGRSRRALLVVGPERLRPSRPALRPDRHSRRPQHAGRRAGHQRRTGAVRGRGGGRRRAAGIPFPRPRRPVRRCGRPVRPARRAAHRRGAHHDGPGRRGGGDLRGVRTAGRRRPGPGRHARSRGGARVQPVALPSASAGPAETRRERHTGGAGPCAGTDGAGAGRVRGGSRDPAVGGGTSPLHTAERSRRDPGLRHRRRPAHPAVAGTARARRPGDRDHEVPRPARQQLSHAHPGPGPSTPVTGRPSPAPYGDCPVS